MHRNWILSVLLFVLPTWCNAQPPAPVIGSQPAATATPSAVTLAAAPATQTPADIFAFNAKRADIRAEGAPPFKLTATFVATDENGEQHSGEYSEIWISRARWRNDLTYGSFKSSRSCVNGKATRRQSPALMSFALRDMLLVRTPQVPQAKSAADANRNWVLHAKKINATPVLEISPSGNPDFQWSYVFSGDGKYPLGRASAWRTVSYDKFHTMGQRIVPFEAILHYAGKQSVIFTTSSLGGVTNPPDDAFAIAGGVEDNCSAGPGSGVIAGNATSPPSILHQAEPEFPTSAKGRVEATVVLQITVDETGRVEDVQVIRSPSRDFTATAVAAARQYTFKPGLLDGEPVAVDIVLEIAYRRN